MNRFDVTEAIVAAKIAKGLKWADIAKDVGQSKEWTTAALLGQMALTKKQAETVGRLLGLGKEAMGRCAVRNFRDAMAKAASVVPGKT
jgi:cyanate lyase